MLCSARQFTPAFSSLHEAIYPCLFFAEAIYPCLFFADATAPPGSKLMSHSLPPPPPPPPRLLFLNLTLFPRGIKLLIGESCTCISFIPENIIGVGFFLAFEITVIIVFSFYKILVSNEISVSFANQPIRDILYNSNGTNSDRSVFVVPRRAYYYDTGVEQDQLRNSVLIISEVNYDALRTISGCEVNGKYATSIRIIREEKFTNWVRGHVINCTHRLVVVECLGISPELIISGAITKLLYKIPGDYYYSRVQTEKPLLLSKVATSRSTQKKASVVVCTAVFNQPTQLQKWLRYQQLIGVDFIHINADVSFNEKAYPLLSKLIENGTVQLDIWNNIVGKRMFYYGQILKYQDCLYRYRGVYEYGLFHDVDEVFNPALPGHKDIHYYFDNAFSVNNIGTVGLFRMFYDIDDFFSPMISGHFRDPYSEINIGTLCFHWTKKDMKCEEVLSNNYLTRIVDVFGDKWMSEKKCAHRLSGTTLIDIHNVVISRPSFIRRVVHANMAYMGIVQDQVCNIAS